MNRLKGLSVFVLIFVTALILNNTKCFAQEVQYTDNVIPTMTSNTSPSGVANASSVWSNANGVDFPAWKAFNHDLTTTNSGWVSVHNTNTGWLSYEFPDAKCITKYTLTSRNPVDNTIYISELPKSWTFEAWDEQSNLWVVLDTQTNITNWKFTIKKEFTFSNTNLYKKYRINITANSGLIYYTAIGELEMMETVYSPTNLRAIAEDSSVKLSWDPVLNAQSYNIKRSTSSGGPYTTIATSTSNTYTDYDVTNGTTYYYVVSAIVSSVESSNSNEAAVLFAPNASGNNALLEINMTNGVIKVYDLTAAELDDFLIWYDGSSNGTNKAYYIFIKKNTIKPYLSKKEYIAYDKISSFEISEYIE